MDFAYASTGLLIVLAILLIIAAVTDLRARIISNRLNIAIAVLAPVYWMACGLPAWPDMAVQFVVGLGVFALFTALFAMGVMGGGDVKLLGAIALWFPWSQLPSMLMIMAIIGGVVTLATVAHHKWKARLGPPEVPYGVAISAAALCLIGEHFFNQFT